MNEALNEIRKTRYVLKWGEKYSTLIVDMFARIAISHPDVISNDISEYVTYIQDRKTVKAFYSKQAIKEINQKHGKYFFKKERIKKLLRDYDRAVKQYENFFNKFNNIIYPIISDEKLHKLFRKYIEFTENNFALFRMTRAEGETGPSEKIKKIIRKYHPEEKIEKIFNILSESTEKDMIGRERESWLEILRRRWNKKSTQKYIMEYAANFVNIYDTRKILNYLKERYKRDKRNIRRIEEEIEEARRRRELIKKKQKEIYAECKNNRDLVDYSRMLQKFGPYRFKLKYAWAGAELHLLKFFQEICKRMKISPRDFFDLYLVNDVFDFFESGKMSTRKNLNERAKCILIRIKEKEYEAYFGKEALKIVQLLSKSDKKRTGILKGNVAFQGRAKGRVRIVHSTDIQELGKIAKSFKKGDILISEGTQPAMIVLMKKAGAILTEVGGLTSHAAIVSREFGKPCIVGIKNLLNILKDGDLVEVDANRGIVRILK